MDSVEIDVIEEAFKYKDFDTIYEKWCSPPPSGRHCISHITDPVIDINVEAGFPENDWLITQEYNYPDSDDFFYLLKHDFMIEGVTAYDDEDAKALFKRVREERYRAEEEKPDNERTYLEYVDCCLQLNEFEKYPQARRFILLYKRVQGSSARSWVRREKYSKYTKSPASKFALSMGLMQQLMEMQQKNQIHGHIHYDTITMENGCLPVLNPWDRTKKKTALIKDPEEVVVGSPDWNNHPYYLGREPISYLDNYDLGLMIFEFSAPRFSQIPYSWGNHWRNWCRGKFIRGDPDSADFEIFTFCRFFYPVILRLTEDGDPVKPIPAAKALSLLKYELLRFISFSPKIYNNFWKWIDEGMCAENEWFLKIVDETYRQIDEIVHYIKNERLASLRRQEYQKLRPEFFNQSGYWEKSLDKSSQIWADWLITLNYDRKKSGVAEKKKPQRQQHQLI